MPRKSKQAEHNPNQRGMRNDLQRQETKDVTLKLPAAHPKQYELINAFELNQGVRFVAGACGTKFGKTYGCTIRIVKEAWENKGSLNWWVAPSYAQATIAFNLVRRLLHPGTFIEYRAADNMKIVLVEPDGTEHSTIAFKSGENDNTLRGFAVNFVIIDEAARIPYESFVSVMTTLTKTKGRAIVISTPSGRGWFYDVYQRGNKEALMPGEKDEFPEWLSIRMPTWMNPTVDLASIEDARRNLPVDVFQQEYGAIFQTEGAGVFRGVRRCGISGMPIPESPQYGRRYVMGVDLARTKDFTVIIVMDVTGGRNHVVYFDRFQDQAWQVQYNRIVQVAKMYNNAWIWLDSTGIGDPIEEAIRMNGCNVEGYKIFGTTPKQQLIENLRVGIEHKELTWPDQLGTLMKELESYEYEHTKTGKVQYSAPEGKHDDCVISLALAWMGAARPAFKYTYKNIRGV
jgi:hypothetical protein